MSNQEKLYSVIAEKIEEIALTLMHHEDKEFCLTQIGCQSWRLLYKPEQDGEVNFVMIPSHSFERLIIEGEYMNVIESYPECFGQNDDRLIVHALKEHNKDRLIHKYTDEEYLEHIRKENMAYILIYK